MAAASALIGILLLHVVSGQVLHKAVSGNGICSSMHCRNLECLRTIDKCVVILGNLTFIYQGLPKTDLFKNMTFYNLKEITGYMAIYMVPVLESIGQLFPNLARIRGRNLMHNYALIIYENNQLNEIGLYSLLKIDRGGVIIWGGSSTCYIDTVDWKTIAPRYRHVLSPANDKASCKRICTCSPDATFNYCWNNMKCQLFTEGVEGLKCHEECLGCRLTNPSQCMICRHFTYQDQCVPRCPNNTIILEDNQYCITEEECHSLQRWVWNNTCVNSCPDDHVQKTVMKDNATKSTICERCTKCNQNCGNVNIMSLGSIQAAHRCVYINGSLTIQIRGEPEAIEEMKVHLRRIEEVEDYVNIHDSLSLTSIDFLPSLRRIGGRKLVQNKFSLIIRENPTLQTVFLPNVTKNLKIDNGSLYALHNPMLCHSEIEKLKKIFPPLPDSNLSDTALGYGLNSYSSGCDEVSLGVKIRVLNLTSAIVKFVPLPNSQLHYTVLYVRVPPGRHTTVVPESCSECEWHVVAVMSTTTKSARVKLTNLRPASTYLVCVESSDLEEKHLSRSPVVNFSTSVGKPEPPFLVELVAGSPHLVVLHWVDHVDYQPHIEHYELSVVLVDIHSEDITATNQCKNVEEELEEEDAISRHAVLMRPPQNYGKACESMCGVLSTVPKGVMVEEDFNICHSLGSACNEIEEEPLVGNSSFGPFIRTLSFSIKGPKNAYQVAHLAPYRDYRFRLRACTNESCSRSTRGVVRTLPSIAADVPTITGIESDRTGVVKVSWVAPIISNGPVLAYTLLLIPDLNESGIDIQQSQTWCVSANQTEIVVSTDKNKNYAVQLCSLSLASRPGCTKLKKLSKIQYQSNDWMWAGFFFAVSLCTVSVLIGYLWTHCRVQSDSVPLVDMTSSYRNDSDPPIFSLLDFTPSLHTSRTDLIEI